MSRRPPLPVLALLTAFVSFPVACVEKGPAPSDAVSRVAERTLTVAEARSMVPRALLQADSAAAMREYAERWERRALLRLEAERLGLHRDPELQRRIETVTDEILSEAMNRHLYAQLDTVEVSDAEVDEFLAANPSLLKNPEASVSVALFVFGDAASAERLHHLARRKNTLDSAFSHYSRENPGWAGDSGPPQPVAILARQHPLLASYFASASAGTPSETFPTADGPAFFVITERHAAGVLIDPQRLKPSISTWLLEQKKNRRLRSLQQSLILRAENDRILTRYE